MKHTLAMAIGLIAIMLASTADAATWVIWYCPTLNSNPPYQRCDSMGKAFYKCTLGHAFNAPAEVDQDGVELGPSRMQCPLDTTRVIWAYADSVRCHNDDWGPHWYFGPMWVAYNYYAP